MPRSFSLPAHWFTGRNRQTAIRAALGTLLLANIVATVLAFYPPGGSPEQLEGDLAVARRTLAARQMSVAALKKNAAKVSLALDETEKFMSARFLDRRTAFSTLEIALADAAKAAGIQPKDRAYGYEPVEGSDTLAIASINANFEGTYADLIEAVHAIDHAQRLVILDSLQAQPIQGSAGLLSINMKLFAFLRQTPEEAAAASLSGGAN
jgi:Tfp pilus assembly protein PilO